MTEPRYDDLRHTMVASQLRTTGVSDSRLIAAMADVPRERFVPEAQRALAYADAMVPLGNGRALNAPMATGLLINESDIQPGDKVLIIGAGTGYAAAIVARLAADVTALEEDAGMNAAAREALAGTPVKLVEGKLADGYAAGAPYDVILADGAIEAVPDALIAQLADGGRLAAAIVENGVTRLAIGHKAGTGFAMVAFVDADAAILPGFEQKRSFVF